MSILLKTFYPRMNLRDMIHTYPWMLGALLRSDNSWVPVALRNLDEWSVSQITMDALAGSCNITVQGREDGRVASFNLKISLEVQSS